MSEMTKDDIVALAEAIGIVYRQTPEGTKEMWCMEHNVTAFAAALLAKSQEREKVLREMKNERRNI